MPVRPDPATRLIQRLMETLDADEDVKSARARVLKALEQRGADGPALQEMESFLRVEYETAIGQVAMDEIWNWAEAEGWFGKQATARKRRAAR